MGFNKISSPAGGVSITDPTVPASGAIAGADSSVSITLDNSGVAHPAAAEVSLSGTDAANFSLPADTLLEVASGGSATIEVSRASGVVASGTCSVDFLMSSGTTLSVPVTAATYTAQRWLEVRLQFDQYALNNGGDGTMIELRSGIAASFGGASSVPGPDQTTGVPIAPIAAGIYPNYVSYASLATTATWPDGSLLSGATDPPSILEAALPNSYWAELPAGSTQNEAILENYGGLLDAVVFFGPLTPTTGYSLAVKEGYGAFTTFLDDANVTVHVRVWTVDPTASAWTTGSPPADGSVPSGVLYPGTAPHNTSSPGTSVPTFSALPGNVLSPTTPGFPAVDNGWSLWALTGDYGGGSSFTHNGATMGLGAGQGDPRVYHVDDAQIGGTHPGVNGTFQIL